MAGIATFTIVVSSRIMKNPVVKTSSTSHGLVRARAMSPPEPFIVGIASDLPLQPAFVDFLLEVANPSALGGHDPAVSLQYVDRVVKGAEIEPDELVLVTLPHRRGKLVGMHGPLVQQLQDRNGKRRDLGGGVGHIPYGI